MVFIVWICTNMSISSLFMDIEFFLILPLTKMSPSSKTQLGRHMFEFFKDCQAVYQNELWHFSFPPKRYEISICFMISPTLSVISLFKFDHSINYVVILNVDLICNCVMDKNVEHLFICFLSSIYLFCVKSV